MSFKETRAVMAGLLAMARLTGDEPTVRQAMEGEMSYCGGGLAPMLKTPPPVTENFARRAMRAEAVIDAIRQMCDRGLGSLGKHALIEQVRQECIDYQSAVGKVLPAGEAPPVKREDYQAIAARTLTDGPLHPELVSELLALGWLPPYGALTWRDKSDIGHTCTIEWAIEQLKRLFDEWPGGLDEVDSAMRTSAERAGRIAEMTTQIEERRKADARVGGFERLLEDIGIVRRGPHLVLTLVDERETPAWDITFLDADGAGARMLAAWMMRKQALLHGGSSPAREAAAVAMMTEPHEESAWIAWCGDSMVASGKERGWPQCPVNRDAVIRVRFRDGEERQVSEPHLLRWPWKRPYVAAADIVAFQIIDDGIPF